VRLEAEQVQHLGQEHRGARFAKSIAVKTRAKVEAMSPVKPRNLFKIVLRTPDTTTTTRIPGGNAVGAPVQGWGK
jgi:hypothetical protein